MSTATLTETDLRLRTLVQRQLDWDPEVNATEIGVAARHGVVALTGFIDSYSGKLAAERAAKRVHGVRAVANDLDVRVRLERPDPDIAADVVQALHLRGSIPAGIQATVHGGHVSLTGVVQWAYQKRNAEAAVRHIRGIKGIRNYITVAPHSSVRDVRRRIVQALHQNADVDAQHVLVTVTGETATLTGSVGSWLQREAAERAAADAPGIRAVDNRLIVEPPLRSLGTVPDEIC